MKSKTFIIQKRDGSSENFSYDRISDAIRKAFSALDKDIEPNKIAKLLNNLDIQEGMTIEDIQNQVEVSLMKEGYFDVAKAYIIYRQQHSEDRETVEKLKFFYDYVHAANNAATASKYDANANVENKNIATLIGELPKKGFIRLNRRMLTDRIKQLY